MRRLSLWMLGGALLVSVCACGSSSDAGGEKQGEVVNLKGLKAPLPAGWKAEKPANNMRMYQIQIPKAGGDEKGGELVVFFFPGGGGGKEANIKRWKDMFRAPKGKDLADVSKVETFKVGKAEVTKLDVEGTYLFKETPFAEKATPLENYRMFAVYFDSDEGPFFIRAVGPAATISENAKRFDEWLKSFQ